MLKDRLSGLECVGSDLLCSQAEVTRLQHQLHMYRQEAPFVDKMRGQLDQLETMQLQVKLLAEENACLKQDRANADLLRFQLHGMKKKCEEVQELEAEVIHLRLENSKLQAGGEGRGLTFSETMQLQLAELQQKELVSLRENGSVNTQSVCVCVSVCE